MDISFKISHYKSFYLREFQLYDGEYDKELYETDFENAVTTLCYESDYCITSIEIIKDFIKKILDDDNFVWAEHLIVALNNTDAYYYEYDFSAGTFETPKPLTELEDLEEYCDDYKEVRQ